MTRNLVALLAVHAIVITAGLHVLASTPRVGTLADQVDRFVARRQSNDSWKPMQAAREYAAEHGTDGLYEEIFFKRRIKFQYPPTSLLFVGDLQRPALNVLAWLAVWITAGVTVLIFSQGMRGQGAAMAARGPVDHGLRLLVVLGLALTFYPLLKGYSLGQIQVWLDALFAILVWAWARHRQSLAGVMLGVMCLVKPQYLLLALWALARGQHRFLAAAAATMAIGVIASVARFGLGGHLEYFNVLTYISRRGEAFYPNQSFNGLLNRLVGNGSNLTWQDHEFPPFHWIVYLGTLAAAVVVIAALRFLVPRRASASQLELAAIAVTATIAAPIAWEHNYGILLPLFAVAVPPMLTVRPFGKWTAALLAASFILTGQFFEVTQRLAATPWNPLQSYVLAGALLFLWVIYATMRRMDQGAPQSA